MRPLKTLAAATILFSLGWVVHRSGAAEPAGGQGQGKVQVTIGTILASNQSNEFDPRLAKLQNQLKVFKYKSYRLIREDTRRPGWNEDAAFEIPGGRSLLARPQEKSGNQLALKVRLLAGEKPLLDTTVKLREGGNFLLGGPAHEGGVLILSIWAASQ
jgi:hypothetical protein